MAKNRIKARNSSLELLRIISMLLIVNFHFLIRNNSYNVVYSTNSLDWTSFVFAVFGNGGGWIGNVVFFTISAWFLIDKEPEIKKSFRRVWILEREVLFWSFSIAIVSYICIRIGFLKMDLDKNFILDTFFPLVRNVWWYATSYVLFLFLSPYLILGLKALNKRMLGWLTGTVIALWGVLTLLPGIHFDTSHTNVFIMILLLIPIAYYKWYCRPLSIKKCVALIVSGYGLYTCYWFVFNLFFKFTGHGWNHCFFIFDCILPPMLIGFGLFLLFERVHYSNRIINFIAKSTFGVYLISENPRVYPFLWSTLFDMKRVFATGHPILAALVVVICVFCVCECLDFVRRGFFAFTFDRHTDKLFECVWSACSQLTQKCKFKISKNS